MLHTKFRENLTAGSGEDFEGFLPYMGLAAILVNFRPPYPRRSLIKFGFDPASGFGEDV